MIFLVIFSVLMFSVENSCGFDKFRESFHKGRKKGNLFCAESSSYRLLAVLIFEKRF